MRSKPIVHIRLPGIPLPDLDSPARLRVSSSPSRVLVNKCAPLPGSSEQEKTVTPASSPAVFKLHQMTQTTPTCLWNDSASIEELTYAIAHGAVGATCNPVIVLGVLKKEMPLWRGRIQALIEDMPAATESEIGWKLVEEISARGAALLDPIFDAHQGRNGRLSIQTDPRFYRNTQAIVEQAMRFSRIARNMIVKIPVTRAGIPAIEEATYRGVSINATVCFTLPQCIAVAEAVERGLKRREQAGKDIAAMGPVCTIMVGRLDDWLKVVADRKASSSIPAIWSGPAWRSSRRPIACSASGATGSGCFRRPSAITCTGANSSAPMR